MSTLRSVYTNLKAARTTIRDVRRFRRIATVLMGQGFGFLFRRFSRGDPALARAVEEAFEEVGRSGGAPPRPAAVDLARRARAAIESLGPVYIKFGQILSTRPDLVPAVFCREFQGLQDNVSPMSADDARAVLRTSLGQAPEEIFAELNETPIAAASIAQVHWARLKSGEEVAVKVQRPGISEMLDADLDILYFLARQVVQVVPEARLFDPVGIVGEFEKAVRRELDFDLEARNMVRVAKNFEDFERVHIPHVYLETSSKSVLTMEFVRGRKITEAVDEGLIEGEVAAREMLMTLFKQLFRDGLFHADQHPGNVWLLDDGRICYLDFGLVGRLSPARKDRVVDILLAIGRQDVEALARALYELGVREGPIDYEAYVTDVSEIAERSLLDKPLSEIDVGLLFRELVEGSLRHSLRMSPDYTMVFKALITVEGLGKHIAPEIDVIAEAQPFISELLKERYSPERLLRRGLEAFQTTTRLVSRLPPAITHMLEEMDAGRFTLKIDHRKLEPLIEARRRSDVYWGSFGVSATLLLCGSLALGFDQLQLFGFPAVSLVAYLLALPSAITFLTLWWRR